MLGVSEQNQAGHPTLGWKFSASWTQRSILSISANTVNKSNFTLNISHPGDVIRCVSILLFMTHNDSPKTGVCSPCLSELLRVHCYIDETLFNNMWLLSDCAVVKTLSCRDFIYSPHSTIALCPSRSNIGCTIIELQGDALLQDASAGRSHFKRVTPA